MHIIEPRPDDRRMTGREYLAALLWHATFWTDEALAFKHWEYRPVNAIQPKLGEYQA